MGKKKNSDHAPFDNIFAPTVIKPKKTKRRPCSLTIVMAIFTALLVLSVASVTFAITYTTSLNTLRTVGRGYAESLASTASVRVTNVFESPASQLRAFGNSLKREGVHFPSEDVSGQAFMNETLLTLMPLFITFPDVYNNMQLVWDDGSTMTLQRDNDTTIVRYIGVNSIEPRSALRLAFNSQTMRLAQTTTDFPDSSWRGATLYPQLRKTLYNADEGVWLPPAFVTINGPGVFALPASFPMRNRTNFMGTINADVAVTSMAEFLSTQKLTSEGNTFVLDGNLAILATSHTTPFVSTNVTTTYPTSLPPNCAVAPTYGSGGSTYTVACRSLASTFSYPPLQRASDDAELVAPRTSSLVFKTLFSSDDTVYVVATRITNSLQNASVLFPVSLLLFVPEADVIGNIVGTRTTVIAIIAAVFVVASGVAAVVIHLVLRPLKDVAANMRNTAKLREVGDNIEMSQLKEVYDLQLAFRRMNAAIGSFTRYVPRDVVKDLMRSGQLCQIQMSKKTCSMLFVDIANFSLLCERVEADCLSSLVRVYFEQMSSIIANHEGVIDKYIGDCIMAVWGAVFGCPNQEVKAALCAFLMDRETHIAPLATRFAQANQTIGVRVGVATGTVLAGNMGSSERMTYTVIGDPVNLASKLEALNQHFDTRVLIDDTTAEKGVGVFCLRKVLKVSLGAQQHVTAYEVLGLLQEIRAEVMEDLRDRRSAFQREYDQTESMDSASSANASSMQSMTTFDTAETAAATLVDRARMLHSPPTVVDDATLEFARCYTEAVEHYVKADFKRCLEILATVHYATNVEPQCHRRLRQMAEDGARLDEPSLATFDGMWHLDEA